MCYLNRKKFPIDFPVWHNPDDVAMGKDAVVDKALDWINNIVYPHSTMADRGYYSPVVDTVHLSTIIENPNVHQLSARAYLKTLENVLIDSVDLIHQLLNPDSEQWVANFSLPMVEEFYKISVTSFDQTALTSFTVPNATRFTTVPLLIDSVQCNAISNYRYSIKPFLKNAGTVQTIKNIIVKLNSDDPWVTSITPTQRCCPNLLPGQTAGVSAAFAVSYDPTTFPDSFNLKYEIMSGG